MSTHDEHPQQDPANETIPDDNALAIIEEQADRSIRRLWHDGRLFFSVIDVIGLLTDSPTPRVYWAMMKNRIFDEEFRHLVAACNPLKLRAPDGKQRETDCADFVTLVSLIHTLPAQHRRVGSITQSQDQDQYISSGAGGVYAIVNTITHERYIGSSTNISARFAQHQTLLRRGKHHACRLQEAWNTYGEEVFAFAVVEEVTNPELLESREQHYLDTEQPTYNSAEVARNRLALSSVSAERVQHVILALYDLHSATTSTPLFRSLREAIGCGLIQPGPRFAIFAQAEASGIATWEDLSVFLHSTRQESKEGEGA